MVAVQQELARPGVMAVTEDLASAAASGVLEIDGYPSGRIYLDRGHLAYARASWVPDLAARLRAIAPSLDAGCSPAGDNADDAAIAWLVVRHGYLTRAELHQLIESIVVDAFLVLTMPLAGEDSPVAAIRFTPAPAGWSDLFPRLGLDAVRAQAVRRAERMAADGLAPTTPVAPRDLAAPTAVLTREQWTVACQIGDRVSAHELAMRRGASLSDMVHCLGSLVRAGLCAPVLGPGFPRAQAYPPAERLPRRTTRSQHHVPPARAPSVELLRQVLSGLRRLD